MDILDCQRGGYLEPFVFGDNTLSRKSLIASASMNADRRCLDSSLLNNKGKGIRGNGRREKEDAIGLLQGIDQLKNTERIEGENDGCGNDLRKGWRGNLRVKMLGVSTGRTVCSITALSERVAPKRTWILKLSYFHHTIVYCNSWKLVSGGRTRLPFRLLNTDQSSPPSRCVSEVALTSPKTTKIVGDGFRSILAFYFLEPLSTL